MTWHAFVDSGIRPWMLAAGLCAALGCGDDSPATTGETTAGMDGTTGGVGTESTNDDDVAETAAASDDETGTPPAQDCDFQESFDVADGQPWPSPWTEVGGVALADVVQGRGRLAPVASGYSLARMVAPLDCADAEVTFAFEFTDASTQGVGFYVRQNGGHLQTTTPRGQGYAAFAENFRDPVGIGAWREIDGSEQMIESIAPFDIQPGVVYLVRLRVTQQDASRTSIRIKLWAEGEAEPDAWLVERSDATPELQGLAGGIAVDAWSSLTSGNPVEIYVDDIVVTAAS